MSSGNSTYVFVINVTVPSQTWTVIYYSCVHKCISDIFPIFSDTVQKIPIGCRGLACIQRYI